MYIYIYIYVCMYVYIYLCIHGITLYSWNNSVKIPKNLITAVVSQENWAVECVKENACPLEFGGRRLLLFSVLVLGFPGGSSGKEPACQCRRQRWCEFSPWVEKIPWGRAWQPTLVFLPGEFHGQRSQAGYSPWVCRVGHDWRDSTHSMLVLPIKMIIIMINFSCFTEKTQLVAGAGSSEKGIFEGPRGVNGSYLNIIHPYPSLEIICGEFQVRARWVWI